MKLSLVFLLLTLHACAQKTVDYDAQLEQLFQSIRMDIGSNQKNLTKQLNAGLAGVEKLESFIKTNKITDYPTLKKWLDLYFATTQYVLDDPKQRTTFLQSLTNSKFIPNEHKTAFASAANDYIEKDRQEREYEAKFEIGKIFPALPKNTVDMNGKAISLNDYKGKIVLVDFWATWCGPCLSELPNVLAVYDKYKSKGFDILGINFDNEDRPKLERFLEEKNMPWRQIYDGKGWQSALSNHYGIKAIPMTFILKDGKIIAKNLRGPQLMAKLDELFKN
jgi:thiol-disulfide isomerase/thioredoxin